MTLALVHGLVRRAAERRPEACAIVGEGETLGYRELDAIVSRLARRLVAEGCRPGDRVALLAPKSPRAVASLVAAMASGALVVPVDAASPAARQARILRRADCRCLLADPSAAARLGELARAGALDGVRVGALAAGDAFAAAGVAPAFTWDELAAEPAVPPEVAFSSDPAAEILFTSGSTGEPKGVVVRHESIVRFVEWALAHFGIGADERLSSHSPLHFDLSTFDLFGTFAAGAELHLVPPELNLLPHRLVAWIGERELTQWFSVPSVLAYAAGFDALAGTGLPALRRLLWCGEVFPLPALRYWMHRLPRVTFTNLYGPTETTIASSFYDVREIPAEDATSLPIGAACAGEELRVLGSELAPVPAGEIGELYIEGVGLSPGYWRDAERTAAAFLPDPAGRPGERIYRTGDLARVDERGRFHLLGRADSQIKSRGYRIELGEIESALAATGLTREAVVTAVPTDGFEGQQICCAYAPSRPEEVTPLRLRGELGRLLPGYMIPSRWLTLERLPRNGSGKLDRRAVRESFARSSERRASPGVASHGTETPRDAARV